MLYYVVLRMIYIHNDMMLYAVYLYINISIFRICSCSNKRTLHRTTRIRAWPLGHRTPPQYWAFITWPPSHMALQPASWMGSGIEYALDQYGEMNLFTYIFHASTCTCMYKYIRIRILHNIIHIYIYISLYSTDLYSETNVFGMVGVEAASRMLSEPWWHRSLGPLCRSRSLDFRHGEAWPNRPKNGLAYNMFIMTPTKMDKWFITIYCK